MVLSTGFQEYDILSVLIPSRGEMLFDSHPVKDMMFYLY